MFGLSVAIGRLDTRESSVAKISTERELERWIDFLRVQPLPFEVECKKWRKPRTLTANAYLWAYVYGPAKAVLGFSEEEWHEYWCIEYFGGVPYMRLDGTEGQRPKRTTTKNEQGDKDVLKGDQFNDFLTFVEEGFASRGVFIERKGAV
jgi:hypothetical protein